MTSNHGLRGAAVLIVDRLSYEPRGPQSLPLSSLYWRRRSAADALSQVSGSGGGSLMKGLVDGTEGFRMGRRIPHCHYRVLPEGFRKVIVRKRPVILGAERQQMRERPQGQKLGNLQQLNRSYTHTTIHAHKHTHIHKHTFTQRKIFDCDKCYGESKIPEEF